MVYAFGVTNPASFSLNLNFYHIIYIGFSDLTIHVAELRPSMAQT